MHTPVLLNEAVEGLKVHRGGLYIDATAGECGHLKKIIGNGGRVLGIDWDKAQFDKAKSKFVNDKRVTLVLGNFKDIEPIAKKKEFFPAAGVLFDLGLSFDQLSSSDRGFSYEKPSENLDMRIGQELKTTAADIINKSSEEELYSVMARNSEENTAKEIARSLVIARKRKPFRKVKDLLNAVDRSRPANQERTYARVFQSFRIEVNHERENLRRGLEGAMNILKIRGRLAVISFHSIEDRIVKMFGIKHAKTLLPIKKIIGKKSKKTFERSAVLRIFEKKI